ncbi:O-antigen biosynthesis protein WbqP [Terribacillus saccharophilus]|uniref:O-antigen biosynthesis protein WbqP n=1 Tax=Terribacillus saccharophilus TaxID=361277 RepID=A0AAX2EFP6_9BACI|nr:O-antigen biosynthesis protein WbqP [Terribacillus saccharophilus]
MKNYLFFKKNVDVLAAAMALIVLWPFLLLISIIIRIDSKGPILFRQKRIGKDKTEFYILKFRTMRVDTPKDMPTHLLNDPNIFITRIGKFLRKTSLDELPQIINILKGEMSIIGPRPALWNQYDLINERDKYGANNVVPGLTGWAQVNGRDEISIILKAKLDGDYVRNISCRMDLKCFFKTIINVAKSDGVVEGKKNIKNQDIASTLETKQE